MTSAKIAAVVLVLAVVVVAQQLGIFEQLKDPHHFGEALVALGVWGYVAFIVAYALLQPFGVPGTIFVVAASLIWPWPIAFALSMTATMCASIIGFSFARFVARDWISTKIPDRFRKYDDALARRALVTVFVLRIVFWMPPLLHAFFGISKVRFWTHFWGSLAGYVLPLFLMSFFGQRLFDAVKNISARSWIELGVSVVAIGLVVWIVRKACNDSQRASSARATSTTPGTRGTSTNKPS